MQRNRITAKPEFISLWQCVLAHFTCTVSPSQFLVYCSPYNNQLQSLDKTNSVDLYIRLVCVCVRVYVCRIAVHGWASFFQVVVPRIFHIAVFMSGDNFSLSEYWYTLWFHFPTDNASCNITETVWVWSVDIRKTNRRTKSSIQIVR